MLFNCSDSFVTTLLDVKKMLSGFQFFILFNYICISKLLVLKDEILICLS